MMVYNTQNYCVFRTLSIVRVLETRKHYVSEIGCFRPLVREGRTPILLGPLETANCKHWTTLQLFNCRKLD
jgi:hypothetical protein